MAKSGQTSFRRILLTRLLLLSVPVLLLGMCVTFSVTYRKARSALLETARQNLTESAVRKGESIGQLIAALKMNLLSASQSSVLARGDLAEDRAFVENLAQRLPTDIQCVQLIDWQTQDAIASTCDDEPLGDFSQMDWSDRDLNPLGERSPIFLEAVVPDKGAESTRHSRSLQPGINLLRLLLGTPVYDAEGNIRYILAIQSLLVQKEDLRPRSLTGYSVILDPEGTILMHPDLTRVGRNILNEQDPERLQSLLRNAIAGRQDFLHLVEDDLELLAGYTAIPSPVSEEQNQKWVVLAVTPLDAALSGLFEIQKTLLTLLLLLTLALISASVLATLYISRELALPLEKLRDYALNNDRSHSPEKIPRNFKIREFNQLAIALKGMLERLKTWAQEVESAWEEAQNANQLKSEFLTTISHELRTPLNGIIGSVSLVKDGFCDDREEEVEFLEQANSAAVHLLGIIDDILDLSKIEAGHLSITHAQTDLGKILNEAIALQTAPIREKGLELIQSERDREYIVYADPDKLKQVFINLIDNAVKFTKTGSITIDVSANLSESEEVPTQEPSDAPITDSEHQVVVKIIDTGIGIEPEQLEKVFLPFVMVDGSTTREAGGAGLGLAISRHLVELMSGKIQLFSPGKDEGTTVTIELPLLKVAE
ncbi:ATP-binding protein [Lusitaniella coriacea]|uniref:ATP-binding protein n=1 Tax=Lusitaniella coriacea TaxID=1983105 RepID=UPI003CEFEA5F